MENIQTNNIFQKIKDRLVNKITKLSEFIKVINDYDINDTEQMVETLINGEYCFLKFGEEYLYFEVENLSKDKEINTNDIKIKIDKIYRITSL